MVGKSEKRIRRLAHIVLICFSLMAVMPFILLIIASFTEEKSALVNGFNFVPKELSIKAYAYMWKQKEMIFRAYGITVFTTVIGTFVGLMMTALLGYGLSKNIPGKRIANFYVVFTMLFSGGLVPTYLIYTKYLHIGNTIWALIVPGLMLSAFNVMLMRNYFSNNIPESLLESAKLDGASEFGIFRMIVLPLSKPIMATVGLMMALAYWNNWTNGLYFLDDASLYSIQNVLTAINNNIIALSSISSSGLAIDKSDIPMLTTRMAIAVIGILPMLVIYPFFQKYFVKGIMIGAVKG